MLARSNHTSQTHVKHDTRRGHQTQRTGADPRGCSCSQPLWPSPRCLRGLLGSGQRPPWGCGLRWPDRPARPAMHDTGRQQHHKPTPRAPGRAGGPSSSDACTPQSTRSRRQGVTMARGAPKVGSETSAACTTMQTPSGQPTDQRIATAGAWRSAWVSLGGLACGAPWTQRNTKIQWANGSKGKPRFATACPRAVAVSSRPFTPTQLTISPPLLRSGKPNGWP